MARKVEFNPDGSIKLPEKIIKQREDSDNIFRNEQSIRVIKNQVSSVTPLECELIIEASDKLPDPERIKSIYTRATGKFRHLAQLRIQKINDRKYVVTIISGQYRCSWCENFREYLEKEMNVKVM